MSRFTKAYGKAYMTGTDLPKGRTIKLIIEGANWQTFSDFKSGKDVDKLVLDFRGDWKPLILSPTNARTIANVLGEDEHSWLGRAIPVYRTKVDVHGQVHEVVRVDDDIESDSDLDEVATPRNSRPQHPGEKLYTGNDKDDGSIKDLRTEAGWESAGEDA